MKANVEILNYSDRAFAVFGQTKLIKDLLKSLGGKFNPFLLHPLHQIKTAGWVFSLKNLDAVKKALEVEPVVPVVDPVKIEAAIPEAKIEVTAKQEGKPEDSTIKTDNKIEVFLRHEFEFVKNKVTKQREKVQVRKTILESEYNPADHYPVNGWGEIKVTKGEVIPYVKPNNKEKPFVAIFHECKNAGFVGEKTFKTSKELEKFIKTITHDERDGKFYPNENRVKVEFKQL